MITLMDVNVCHKMPILNRLIVLCLLNLCIFNLSSEETGGNVLYEFLYYQNFISSHSDKEIRTLLHDEPTNIISASFKELNSNLDKLQADIPVRLLFSRKVYFVNRDNIVLMDGSKGYVKEGKTNTTYIINSSENGAYIIILSSVSPDRLTIFTIADSKDTSIAYDSFKHNKIGGKEASVIGNITGLRYVDPYQYILIEPPNRFTTEQREITLTIREPIQLEINVPN